MTQAGEDAGLGTVEVAQLVLAVNEAATNSILHSGSAVVRVIIRLTADGLEATVSDDGRFASSFSPEREGGWGLRMMASAVEGVSIRRGTERRPGTSVTLVKAGATTPAGTARSDRRRVLLFEPDRFAARSLATFLRAEGFDVIVSDDLGEGRAELKASAPDLLVVNLTMNSTVAEWARDVRGGDRPRILGISTFDMPEDEWRELAHAFAVKPLHPLHVLEIAQGLLGKRGARAPVEERDRR